MTEMITATTKPPSWLQQFANWFGRQRLRNKLAVALIALSFVMGTATYAALRETPFFANDPNTITVLLSIDLILLVLLGSLITQRVIGIWSRRKKNMAGSKLHVKMVTVFTFLAVAPALIVAAFAAIFFYLGIENWFDKRVSTAINESLEVAQAYLKEHQQNLKADAFYMAMDINRNSFILAENANSFAQYVANQAALRSLTEAIVFDGSGKILARSGLTFSLTFEPISEDMLEQARRGDVVLLVSENDDRVRALLRLDNFVDTFLFVGRLVDQRVMAHMATTQGAVKQFQEMEASRLNLQIAISLLFIVVALVLLMTAVWFGLNFATRLVSPIGELIATAERVRAGDLSARVSEASQGADDEIGLLGRAFNRMTTQIESQRGDLVEANHLIDLRRRFTEAILAGVSAGVIGLDKKFNIHLMNISASEIFHLPALNNWNGRPIIDVLPEIAPLLDTIPKSSSRMVEGQIDIKQSDMPTRTLLVRITTEVQENDVKGYVVTFDDVSELLSAQRKAAWADVARRIAHEIKNPLTPIQLSAERLRRKYIDEIQSDPETFKSCTDTIIRHVDDIGRMVDEFSAFARMPTAVMRPHDIREVCLQVLFLYTNTRADIRFLTNIPRHVIEAICDSRQVAQALTNLLKNAVEAIENREPMATPMPQGEIELTVDYSPEVIEIKVRDNGRGLPVEDRHRLTEPYVTTRTKGTGLGLAIVKKIMEDHKGEVLLHDNGDKPGATVILKWPRQMTVQDETILPQYGKSAIDDDDLILSDPKKRISEA
jgi:two-component system, NtrC family, nitrogen regulation sensor histidine kinase NtrY